MRCRALLRIPTTGGRSVCLCWTKSNPKGPKATFCLEGSITKKPQVMRPKVIGLDVHSFSHSNAVFGGAEIEVRRTN